MSGSVPVLTKKVFIPDIQDTQDKPRHQIILESNDVYYIAIQIPTNCTRNPTILLTNRTWPQPETV